MVISDPPGSATLWIILGVGAVGAVSAVRASSLAVVVAALLAGLELRDPSPWGTWGVAGGLLFLFALRRPRFDAVAAGVFVAATVLFAAFVPLWGSSTSGAFGLVALATAVVGVGQWVQAQRRYVAAEVGRRRQEAERRRQEVARHVAEERLRIARELHDSVAHHLAVVSVHTNVARINLTRSPQVAEHALEDVQAATHSVMEELGIILSVLRASESEVVPSTPVDAAMIEDLLLSFEGIGLKVETDGLDHLLALAPVARTAAQRLLQEALTNAQRYGDGGVTVVVDAPVNGYVTLSVRNPWVPRETVSAGSGLGLVGMEERVHLLGGTFYAGPDTEEGFVVTAQLPAAAPRSLKETPV
ncbi:sensor histidine kinase [Streptomyces sp. NPDC002701]|uniref:sensor histidine kinase n=1 Tax=Streptomyces sp. NPDC002701 TaxID=3364661 RepID=UPI0036B98095